MLRGEPGSGPPYNHPYEQQSIFPTQFNGHGFHIRDYTKGYTDLQEGPYVHPSWPRGKANIDGSYGLNLGWGGTYTGLYRVLRGTY